MAMAEAWLVNGQAVVMEVLLSLRLSGMPS